MEEDNIAEICKNCERYWGVGACRGFVDSGRDDCPDFIKLEYKKEME